MIRLALSLTLFLQANGSKASAVQKQKTAWKSDDSAGEQRTTDALQVPGQHLPHSNLARALTFPCAGLHRRQARRLPAFWPRVKPPGEYAGRHVRLFRIATLRVH